jgi:Tfp pilus assembly protein PilF
MEMDRMQKLREWLAASPADSFLQHALAMEHLRIGDKEEARRLLEKLLNDNPAYVGSYYQLAALLQSMGRKEEALEWYEKGMKAAAAAGDRKALGELRSAYDELMDE